MGAKKQRTTSRRPRKAKPNLGEAFTFNGEKAREKRESLGLSLADVATRSVLILQKLGKSEKQIGALKLEGPDIGKMERGEHEPGFGKVVLYARALGLKGVPPEFWIEE